ncbi:hypothetical protein F4823DRAFT_88187 [Ustulina deusta]|nr:hypothetical protein F4823DRAFT_88187 [Ustulina deusta]
MKVTTDLGYSYIWIDSLCIIQNDASEWEAECPRMGFVYLNGDCNLSANGVLGTDNAIMCDRDPIIHTPALITVPGVGCGVSICCSHSRGRTIIPDAFEADIRTSTVPGRVDRPRASRGTKTSPFHGR